MFKLDDDDMLLDDDNALIHTRNSEYKLACELKRVELGVAGTDNRLQYLANLKFLANGNLSTFLLFKMQCAIIGLGWDGEPLIVGKNDEVLFHPAFECRNRQFEESYI